MVALVVPDVTNPYFFGIVRGTAARLRADGYVHVLVDAEESVEAEERALRALRPTVDGAVLAASRLDDDRLTSWSHEFPMVTVNRPVPDQSGVLVDTAGGTGQALAHLASLGHRRVAYAGGPRASWSDRRRRAVLRTAAKRLDVEVIAIGPYVPRREDGAAAADAALHEGVTAVLAFDDLLAFGILDRLAERGVDVPGAMSVVGCDDVFGADLVRPGLTTIAAPLERAGPRGRRPPAGPPGPHPPGRHGDRRAAHPPGDPRLHRHGPAARRALNACSLAPTRSGRSSCGRRCPAAGRLRPGPTGASTVARCAITATDLLHLRRAVELAREALDDGDEPYGSVLVDAAGQVRFEDRNRVKDGDETRHPEFEIARWSANHLTPDERAAVDRLHVRRALPDVRRGPRLGRPGPDRVRDVVRADRRLAGGVGRPRRARSQRSRSPTVAPGIPVEGPVPALADEVRDLQRRRFGR